MHAACMIAAKGLPTVISKHPSSAAQEAFLLHFRNIDKAGSLDSYIMNTPDKHLDSDLAIDLKIEMLQKLLKEQMATSTATQGLPAAAQAALQEEPETALR